jgi:dTMP kinase
MLTRKLIVLEGAEGAGKTTQLSRLGAWLESRGSRVESFREPGGTPLGDEIRRLLLSGDVEVDPRAEALLFMSSRAQLVSSRVRPALLDGAVVLLDRFFLSTYAYQVAGRGLGEDAVRAANGLATGGLVPDMTILLAIDPGRGFARVERRGARDRMERAEKQFHERVGAAFRSYAEGAWQLEHPECGPIAIVDADQPEERVFESIVQLLIRRWPENFPVNREELQ